MSPLLTVPLRMQIRWSSPLYKAIEGRKKKILLQLEIQVLGLNVCLKQILYCEVLRAGC